MDDFSNALSALGVTPDQSSQAPKQAAPSNNPGNIRPQGSNTGFQSYSTPEQGIAAMDDNLKAYGEKHGINTISGVINRWAPSSENNTPAYIADVSKRLSVDPNAQIDLSNPVVRHALTTAIMLHENGPKILTAGATQPQAQAAPPASQAATPDNDFSRALDAINKAPADQAAPAVAATSSAPQQASSGSWFQPGAGSAGKQGNDPHAPITSPSMDLTAHLASGALATPLAGISGLVQGGGALIDGKSPSEAMKIGSDTVDKVQNALTYQPRTDRGAQMASDFDTSNYNPLNWLPRASSYLGQQGGNALAQAGYPGAGAVVAGAGAAAPAALGLAARPISSMLKGGGAVADVPRVDPTMEGGAAPAAAVKPRYKMVNGQPTLIEEGASPQTVAPVSPNGPAPVPVGAQAPQVAPAAPSLAQATPELQKAVSDAQAKGITVPQDVLARHVEADTLPVPVKLTTGQAALNPELISNEMNSRGKGQGAPVSPDFYNAQGKALASNLDVMRNNIAPDVPTTLHPTDAGQTLIDQYKAMDAPVRADITAKYKALEQANGGQFPLNGKDFVSAADQALTDKNKARYLPPEIQGDLSDLREGGPMTFNSFENLRTTLAAAGRKADRAGDGNASYAINLVRNSLESLPMTDETAAIKPLADAARQAAANRFSKLNADPAYAAAVNDGVKMGEPSPQADRFVQNYLINGKGANVKNMKANLADSDIANQTIAASGLDYLKGVAKADSNTGNFAADSYNKGLKQLGPKMGDIFNPETAQQAQQVGNVAKYTSASPRGSFVNSSNSMTALGSPAAQAAISTAKSAAEHGTNMAFGGIPVGTGLRKLSEIVGATKDAKAAAADSKASTDPLAGFRKLSDLGK